MRTFTWWCTLEDFHCPWRVRKCHCNTVWVTTTGTPQHSIPQHSLPLYPEIWARAVVFTRSSPPFGPEGGQKWLQMHLCSAAVPFLSPSVLLFHQLLQKKPTDDSVKKEPVTGEKLYKAFLFLSMKAMAKLCLPGASQMRG